MNKKSYICDKIAKTCRSKQNTNGGFFMKKENVDVTSLAHKTGLQVSYNFCR